MPKRDNKNQKRMSPVILPAVLNRESWQAFCQNDLMPLVAKCWLGLLTDPTTPPNVLVNLGDKIRVSAYGPDKQSMDITNSDGSMSPLDIKITFGGGEDVRA